MKDFFTLPLEMLDGSDVTALTKELTRLDLPELIVLVEREAQRARREGGRMRNIEIPVDYDFAVLPTSVQDDWRRQCLAKVAEHEKSLPVLAAFFRSYANVIARVQQHERDALAWFAAELDRSVPLG